MVTTVSIGCLCHAEFDSISHEAIQRFCSPAHTFKEGKENSPNKWSDINATESVPQNQWH